MIYRMDRFFLVAFLFWFSTLLLLLLGIVLRSARNTWSYIYPMFQVFVIILFAIFVSNFLVPDNMLKGGFSVFFFSCFFFGRCKWSVPTPALKVISATLLFMPLIVIMFHILDISSVYMNL